MRAPRTALLVGAALLVAACGSVTSAPDGGRGGSSSAGTGAAAGTSAGGTTGSAGTSAGGTTGAGGTSAAGATGGGGTSTGGTSAGGTTGAGGRGGLGGLGGLPDGGVLTCHVDLNDCPNGYTCACGGAGVGMCTCHKNCTDATQCGTAEPMCGCPAMTGGARFCVNACFCNCR
jgi:hypothetical protein